MRQAKKQPKRYNKSFVRETEVDTFSNHRQLKKDILIVPRSVNQEAYTEQLLDPQTIVTFGIGPAGTGKTMLAVLAAIRELKNNNVEKIVVTRPAVGVDDEKHGFLPGDINAKMEPWTRPIFDILFEYYHPKQVEAMIEDGVIEISPLAFMRGRTFKNSFIIADEMQNASPNQMKMLLTRIGENSQMVVTGDVRQTDKRDSENGLLDFEKLLSQYGETSFIEVTRFVNNDIERHPVVSEVLKIYNED